jgi:hypothetical protein
MLENGVTVFSAEVVVEGKAAVEAGAGVVAA